jgi:hypothetical protein
MLVLRDIVLDDNTHVQRFEGLMLFIKQLGVAEDFSTPLTYIDFNPELEIMGKFLKGNNSINLIAISRQEYMLYNFIDHEKSVRKHKGIEYMFATQPIKPENFFISYYQGDFVTIFGLLLQEFPNIYRRKNYFDLYLADGRVHRYYLKIPMREFETFMTKCKMLIKLQDTYSVLDLGGIL